MSAYNMLFGCRDDGSRVIDIDTLRSRYVNVEFDAKSFRLAQTDIVTIAQACGERRAEFCDPTHPDFQAPPAMLAGIANGRSLPIDFPALGGIAMDGGKAVTTHKPVPAGVDLTARSHIHDVYEKSGRSGTMRFIVVRMQIYDADGSHLATTDSRMVVRERPSS